METLARAGAGAISLVLRQAQDEENQQFSDLILSLSKDEVAFTQTFHDGASRRRQNGTSPAMVVRCISRR